MSSILTNTSAMVALQTMRGINTNLAQTQNEISTGKSVANARDNAAVWAVSKTMEADVKGFSAISDTLALGRSTIGVARAAAETVTDLLTEMQGKIVAAQEDNVDRAKIQNDVDALSKQIQAVVGAAQFNGLNLLNGSSADEVSILSSLDRASDGQVSTSTIDVGARNFGINASVVDTTDGTYAAGGGAAAQTIDGVNASRDFTIATVTAGTAYSLSLDFTGIAGDDAGGTLAASGDIAYVAAAGDTAADVLAGLAAAFEAWAGDNDAGGITVAASGNDLTIERAGLGVGETIAVAIDTVVSDDNQAAGGLFAMAGIDVSTAEGAESALDQIEGLIQFAIGAAADFGSAQGRIDTQAEFVQNLTDALTTGIGALVDADMEAASARLQALQVQQQLAIQSLSIANQAPQNILALFR
ncbi:MAG: flagellin [Rhodobacteraceae bacterium]|nr:flagellin [Paracoccaceae bacterium]